MVVLRISIAFTSKIKLSLYYQCPILDMNINILSLIGLWLQRLGLCINHIV